MRSQFHILFLLALMGCNLFSKSSDPVDPLPAITQEGKNTLGFRLNGSIWKPKGFNGTSNLYAIYDPTFEGGSLGVNAYYKSGGTDQAISFGGNNIATVGTYVIQNGDGLPGALFSDIKTLCDYIEPDPITGQFTISKLDLVNRIVSGTFQFTFTKPGCQDINVTEGRFDIKF